MRNCQKLILPMVPSICRTMYSHLNVTDDVGDVYFTNWRYPFVYILFVDSTQQRESERNFSIYLQNITFQIFEHVFPSTYLKYSLKE